MQPTRAYAAYVLARTSRVDPGRLRALDSDLGWTTGQGTIVPASVDWRGAGLASPLSLAQLAGAQSLMGDAAASAETFRLALANIDPRTGAAVVVRRVVLEPVARHRRGAGDRGRNRASPTSPPRCWSASPGRYPDPRVMNTQEKAWMLAAAHALQKQGGSRMLSVDGAPAQTVSLPFAVSPSDADIVKGTSVRNMDTKPVFRTVTLRGSPVAALPALSEGFHIRRETFTLNGDKLDDTKLRQTDRFIVVLSGSVDNDTFRRTVVADPLPAGLEIEAPVLREDQLPVPRPTHDAAGA